MKEQLGTRIEATLRRRLRVHAAVTGRTVEDLVSEALEGYLPHAPDMTRDDGEELAAEPSGMA